MTHLTTARASFAALLACAALLPVATPARAGVVTTGCGGPSPVFGVSCTLEELGRGGSFQIDGLLFTNFTYVPDARGPHEIVFIPEDLPAGPSFTIRRDGRVLMESGQNLQEFLDLRFDVFALDGSAISSMAMAGNWGYQRSTANEAGSHIEVRVDGAPAQDPALSAQRLFCGDCSTSPFDAGPFEFQPTLRELTLDLHAHVFAGTSDPEARSEIGLVSLAFTESRVPEPASLALLLAGLVAAGVTRRPGARRH